MHYLAYERASVHSIVEGLDEEAWHTPVVPSGWTPAGLVEHLGDAERHWFQLIDGSLPPRRARCSRVGLNRSRPRVPRSLGLGVGTPLAVARRLSTGCAEVVWNTQPRRREGPMGIYADYVLPRLQDKVMKRKETVEVRRRVCSGLSGDVVEIGFGTGRNVPYFPSDVRRVLAIEPSRLCMRLAAARIAASSTDVELAGLTGEHVDLPTESIDAVLSTWTLCTIPNLGVALEEVRRVLKPGGTFHFVEHGHAPDATTARWQRRIEPLNKKVAGGCHLTRRVPEFLTEAGFRIDHLDSYYFEGEPKVFGYTFEGQASKP
ncbi:MAG: class I SAM-dependent methyltransferase [Acidimicrobiales bacterium]